MPHRQLKTRQDCEDFVRGCTIMGIGGGGKPEVGLKYLPESLALGPFRPEITLARNGIEGLPDYRLTWNEASWVYSARFGSVNIACALLFLYQSIFPRSEAEALDVPGKLEATTRMLALSAGYDLFRGLRLSVQAKVGSGLVTGGIQLSLAV